MTDKYVQVCAQHLYDKDIPYVVYIDNTDINKFVIIFLVNYTVLAMKIDLEITEMCLSDDPFILSSSFTFKTCNILEFCKRICEKDPQLFHILTHETESIEFDQKTYDIFCKKMPSWHPIFKKIPRGVIDDSSLSL